MMGLNPNSAKHDYSRCNLFYQQVKSQLSGTKIVFKAAPWDDINFRF